MPAVYDKLSVHIYPTRAEMGKAASEACVALLNQLLGQKEELNLIFAAAPSQNEFLEGLADAGRNGRLDFSRINAFHMDEYIGLAADAPQGFGNFLRARLFDRVPFKRVYCIDPTAEPEAEARRYAALLAAHPCDLVCMGIGENGHIAFNDPHVADFDDPLAVKAVELDGKCRMQQVHDGCFAALSDVPAQALTLTVPALTRAPHIICVVPGPAKAEAVRSALEGPVAPSCPASVLRRCEGASLWLDSGSAALLKGV